MVNPKTYKDIVNQYILYNNYLKINRAVITPAFFKINNADSIKNIRIYDMISPYNALLNHAEFNIQNKTNLSVLNYNALKSCIPRDWKHAIVTGKKNNVNTETVNPIITINNIRKDITIVKSKELYTHLILQKSKPPSSLETWVNLFPFLEQYNWKDIFNIPFKYVREPYLQSFQYKIINRILNTNEKLHTWKIKKSNKCDYCQSIDTIEHHLFYCQISKTIWDQLETWLYNHFEIKLNLTVCEVLFGLPYAINEYIELINFVIILCKWYINSKKVNNEPLYFIELLNRIREKLKLLILTNNMNNRANKPWQDTLDEKL